MEKMLHKGYDIEAGGVRLHVRRLTVNDIFPLSRIMTLGAAGLPAAFLQKEASAGALEEMIVAIFTRAMPLAEDEIKAFCASVVGLSADEFSNMPPAVFPKLVDCLMKHIDLQDFFVETAAIMPPPAK